MAASSGAHQPLASPHAALHQEDILDHIFHDAKSLCWNIWGNDRATLARCTIVCRSWTEPASRVLWRELDSLVPLLQLLASRRLPPPARGLWDILIKGVDLDAFVQDICTNDRNLWERFLRRAAHIHHIESYHCRERMNTLIRSIVKHNGGSTPLPSLRTLVWYNRIPGDTTLNLLASPSLHALQLDFPPPGPITIIIREDNTMETVQGPTHRVDMRPEALLSGLPAAAPSLTHLIIMEGNLNSSVVAPHLSRFYNLCSLYLPEGTPLKPDDLQSILTNLPNLSSIRGLLRDFAYPRCRAYSTSIRNLDLGGAAHDITGLFTTFLEAPNLTTLVLQIVGAYSHVHDSAISALSSAEFKMCIRELSVSTSLSPVASNTDHPDSTPLLSTKLVAPLSAFGDVAVVTLSLWGIIDQIYDADICALARAWPRLRKLTLSYHTRPHTDPLPSGSPQLDIARQPASLASLRHFAAHSRELRRLVIKASRGLPLIFVAGDRNVGGGNGGEGCRASQAGHPLESLEVSFKDSFDALERPLDTAAIARFFDDLFPNLALDGEAMHGLAEFQRDWRSIVREIRAVRASKATV
ncbi:hypothetical protein C8Q77DRAFT_1058364 [Trametes polyzona]|nr:hypothetical protein C8Q77DRAFT_1058364 [Trametes polyzona]